MRYSNFIKGNIKLIRNRKVKKDNERDLNLIKDIMRTLGIANRIQYTESDDNGKPNINFQMPHYIDLWTAIEDRWNYKDITSINADANELRSRLEKEKQSIILHINYDEIESSSTAVNNTIEAIISESGMCSLVYQPGKSFSSFISSNKVIIEDPDTKYLTEEDFLPTFIKHIQSFLKLHNLSVGNEFKPLFRYIDYMEDNDDDKKELINRLMNFYVDLLPDYTANKDKSEKGTLKFKVREITSDTESRTRDFNITFYIAQGRTHIVKTHFKMSILKDNVYFAYDDTNKEPIKKEKVLLIFLTEYDRVMSISIENSDKAFK